MSPPWKLAGDAVLVRVRLTPNASRDALEGVQRLDDASEVVAARVRAVPEDGKANEALVRLLARALGLAKREVTLTAGAKGRIKTLRLGGDAGDVIERLRALGQHETEIVKAARKTAR